MDRRGEHGSPVTPRVLDRPTDRLVSAPFIVAVTAMFLYFVFVGMLIPTLPVFIEDGLGGGELAIGATVVAFAVGAIAVRPLITWIGERNGRRTLMVWGAVIAAVAGAALAFVDSVAAIMPLRAAMGVGEAALFVGASTLVADLSPPERRAESASYLSAAVFGGISIGPILGELALGDDRFTFAFLSAAACSAVAAIVSLWAPVRVGPPPAPETVARPRAVWLHSAAVLPGVVLALGIAGWTAFTTFVPTYVDDLGMSGSAAVFALYSALCFVLRIVGAKVPERIGLSRAVNTALVLLAVGLFMIAGIPQALGLYGATVLIALGVTFFYPSLLAASVNAVPESERVGVVSSFTMFFEVGTAMGGLVLGLVGELAGKRATFAAGGLIVIVGLVVLDLMLVPRMKQATPPAAEAPV